MSLCLRVCSLLWYFCYECKCLLFTLHRHAWLLLLLTYFNLYLRIYWECLCRYLHPTLFYPWTNVNSAWLHFYKLWFWHYLSTFINELRNENSYQSNSLGLWYSLHRAFRLSATRSYVNLYGMMIIIDLYPDNKESKRTKLIE